jgi:hypothetical protein
LTLGNCPASQAGVAASQLTAVGVQLRAITQRPATQATSSSAMPAAAQAVCLQTDLHTVVASPGPAAKQLQQSVEM